MSGCQQKGRVRFGWVAEDGPRKNTRNRCSRIAYYVSRVSRLLLPNLPSLTHTLTLHYTEECRQNLADHITSREEVVPIARGGGLRYDDLPSGCGLN